jgi:hypothetical protein
MILEKQGRFKVLYRDEVKRRAATRESSAKKPKLKEHRDYHAAQGS